MVDEQIENALMKAYREAEQEVDNHMTNMDVLIAFALLFFILGLSSALVYGMIISLP